MAKPEVGITLDLSLLLSAWMFSFCCMEGVVRYRMDRMQESTWKNRWFLIGIRTGISLVLLI